MADPVADEWVTLADDEWVDLDGQSPAQQWAESQGVPPELAQRFGAEADQIDAQTTGSNLRDVALGLAPLGAIGKYLPKIPGGRLLTAGAATAKGIVTNLPLVGKPIRAGAKAGIEAWRGSAPKAAAPVAEAAAPAVAGVKPKLSAQQVKQMMREQYGAEKGGRMLFGQARPGVTAASRTQLMRTGTSGGALPKAAQRAIERELAGSTADEAFAYAAKAPNAQAETHFGELLKQALQQRMSGR